MCVDCDGHTRTEEALIDAFEGGVRFVEQYYGRDWYQRINLETFDLWSNSRCVIGQLDASHNYTQTMTNKWKHVNGDDYGFNGSGQELNYLQGLWETRIKELLHLDLLRKNDEVYELERLLEPVGTL